MATFATDPFLGNLLYIFQIPIEIKRHCIDSVMFSRLNFLQLVLTNYK